MRIRIGVGVVWAVFLSILFLPVSGTAEDYDPPRYCPVVPLRADASLRAIAFRDADVGIAVGAYGAMLRTDDGGASWQPIESSVTYQLDDIAWLDEQRVVAVGGAYDPIMQITRGVVVYSTDGGRRWWRAADNELPRLRSVRVRPDDGSLVASGDWSAIVLSREFESRDGGRTWNSSGELDGFVTTKPEPSAADLIAWVKATRVPIPIRGSCRVQGPGGTEQLWAVGDHGVIVHRETATGQWKVRRGLGNRTAVFVISAKPTTVPWPLLGKEAFESQTRVALLTLDPHQQADQSKHAERPRQSRHTDATFAAVDLVRQAAAGLGVSSVDSTTIDSSAPGDDETAAWMAIHRPAVVVIDQALDQQTRTALTEAAISFGAQRVIKYSFDSPGESLLHRNAMFPRSGVLASDLWQDALQLVNPSAASAHSISLRRLYDSAGNRIRGDSLTLGVKLNRGQKLDAKTEPASRRQLQMAQARLKHAAQITNLMRSSQRVDDFAAGLKQLLDQTAKDDQLRLAWHSYQEVANEQSSIADVVGFNDAVLAELQERFEGSSVAWYASLRRQSIRHSLEWTKLKSSLAASLETATVQTAAVDTVPVSPFQVAQASATTLLAVPDTSPVRTPQRTAGSEIIDMNWEFHPLALVSREAARLRGDDTTLQTTSGISANLRRLLESSDGHWAALLRWEGPDVIKAHATEARPRLDGLLDEPCWQTALPAAGNRQRIRCAYDDQFLYLAIITPAADFADDDALPASDKVRDRDLTPVDRLQISLDVDLDLSSAMNLELTRSGRTHDSIDRQPQWQPNWFVASKQVGEFVITELAILRRDLADLPIVAGQSWFVRAQSLGAGEPTVLNLLPSPTQWKRIVFY